MNSLVKRLNPELSGCNFSLLLPAEEWNSADSVLESGEPCFISAGPFGLQEESGEQVIKPGYIWVGSGLSSFKEEGEELLQIEPGYYHFTTGEAYKEIARRLKAMQPPGMFRNFYGNNNSALQSKEDVQNYYRIRDFMHATLRSKRPLGQDTEAKDRQDMWKGGSSSGWSLF